MWHTATAWLCVGALVALALICKLERWLKDRHQYLPPPAPDERREFYASMRDYK